MTSANRVILHSLWNYYKLFMVNFFVEESVIDSITTFLALHYFDLQLIQFVVFFLASLRSCEYYFVDRPNAYICRTFVSFAKNILLQGSR